MMIKKILLPLATVVLVLSVISWFQSNDSVIEKQTLQITTQLPIDHPIGQNLLEFKEYIETKTNGNLEIKIFSSAELYSAPEVENAVKSGKIEMGTVLLPYMAQRVPGINVFSLPFFIDSEEKRQKILNPEDFVRKSLDGEIEKRSVKVLSWLDYGQSIFLSNGAPVKLPKDLKNKKVRVYSKTHADLIKLASGKPSLIPGSKQYDAYKDGKVDIGSTGITTIPSRKLWDVFDTVSMTNELNLQFLLVINNEVWNKLPEKYQTVITQAAVIAENKNNHRMKEDAQSAIQAAKDHGMNVYQLSKDEIAQWRKASKPLYDQHKTKLDDLGYKVFEFINNL